MESLALIVGHLVGDFLLQNDWMAKNKKTDGRVCWLHCFFYTFAVWLATGFPAGALVVIFGSHFVIDRWSFVQQWMSWDGQDAFASPPMSPWSIIVVDNTFHLIILFAAGCAVWGGPKGGFLP